MRGCFTIPDIFLVSVGSFQYHRVSWHSCFIYEAWSKVVLLEREVDGRRNTCTSNFDVISRSVGNLQTAFKMIR